jgi:hypothetical protein
MVVTVNCTVGYQNTYFQREKCIFMRKKNTAKSVQLVNVKRHIVRCNACATASTGCDIPRRNLVSHLFRRQPYRGGIRYTVS